MSSRGAARREVVLLLSGASAARKGWLEDAETGLAFSQMVLHYSVVSPV